MTAGFWMRRFLVALVVAFAVLFLVHLAKGYADAETLQFAAVWSLISAGLFTVFGYIRYRRNPTCMLPRSQRS